MKRIRGGQPGNQNARKHGLYCGPMTPDEMCQLWNVLNTTDIQPEMAVLRIKLLSAIERDPGNHRLIRDAARLAARWEGARLRLSERQTNLLRKTYQRIIEAGPDGVSPEVLAEMKRGISE